MSSNRQICPCGSGKAMRRCCGLPSSQAKLALETTARRLSQAGMHAEAAVALRERVRLSPQNPMIWNDLGVEQAAAGQAEEAREAFTHALRALSDYPLALYNLGRLALERCAAEQAKPQPSQEGIRALANEAIQNLEVSVLKDPLRYHTHAALSAAYAAAGNASRAKFYLEEASHLKPPSATQAGPAWIEHLVNKTFAKRTPQTPLPYLFSSGKELPVGQE